MTPSDPQSLNHLLIALCDLRNRDEFFLPGATAEARQALIDFIRRDLSAHAFRAHGEVLFRLTTLGGARLRPGLLARLVAQAGPTPRSVSDEIEWLDLGEMFVAAMGPFTQNIRDLCARPEDDLVLDGYFSTAGRQAIAEGLKIALAAFGFDSGSAPLAPAAAYR